MDVRDWLNSQIPQYTKPEAPIFTNIMMGMYLVIKAKRPDIEHWVNQMYGGPAVMPLAKAFNQPGLADSFLGWCAYGSGPADERGNGYCYYGDTGRNDATQALMKVCEEFMPKTSPGALSAASPELQPFMIAFNTGAQAAAAGNAIGIDGAIRSLVGSRGWKLAAIGVALIPLGVTWVKCPQACQVGPSHYDPFPEQEVNQSDPGFAAWSTMKGLPIWCSGLPGLIVQAKQAGIVSDDPVAAFRRPDPAAVPGTDTDGCSWFKASLTDAQWEEVARSLLSAPGFIELDAEWASKAPGVAKRLGR